MDFDSLKDMNSGLGTAAVIVINKDQDLVSLITRISKFYKHESCGQCTPCREGAGWLYNIMKRIRDGKASLEEIDILYVTTNAKIILN